MNISLITEQMTLPRVRQIVASIIGLDTVPVSARLIDLGFDPVVSVVALEVALEEKFRISPSMAGHESWINECYTVRTIAAQVAMEMNIKLNAALDITETV